MARVTFDPFICGGNVGWRWPSARRTVVDFLGCRIIRGRVDPFLDRKTICRTTKGQVVMMNAR